MAATAGDIVRGLRLHCPLMPAMLCRTIVQMAYEEYCNRRPWAHLRGEGQIVINAAKTGTCDVTQGSAAVSGGSLVYAASDAGRQFRAGVTSPIYTIIAATVAGYTLDRVWAPASATATDATVLDAYVTAPTDFARWLAVLDTVNNWQLHHWITEDEINTWDAQRSSTGTPWALASRRLSTYSATTGQIQYELWPYALSAKFYPYYYIKTPEVLADDTTLLGPLGTRSSALLNLALALAAEWPGPSPDKKNPYFSTSLGLAQAKRRQADLEMDRLEVLDEEIFMTWWQTVDKLAGYSWAPIDSKFLQSHDVPLMQAMQF